MARYQYETSPRKYEPEYTTRRTTKKKVETAKVSKKEIEKKKAEKARLKKIEERKKKTKQVMLVIAMFGMLLTVSYREIAIMEMFNQKKELESKLALIEKENGQVEKSIKEEESTLDWNNIQQIASEELGMQAKKGIPIELDKTDNVETEKKFIKEDNTSILEKIISYIINK